MTKIPKEKPAEDVRIKKQHRYNQLLSILNKEGGRVAQWIGQKAATDSWLRSDMFARIFGVLSSWVESQADSVSSPFGAAAVEKLSDVMGGIGDELIRKKGDPQDPPANIKTEAKPPIDWISKFQKEAAERLQKAVEDGTEDAEFEKLKKQFAARKAIFEWIEKEMNPAAPASQPSKPPATLMEELKQLKAEFGPPVKQAAQGIDAEAEKLAVHVRALTGWLKGKETRDRGPKKEKNKNDNDEDNGQDPKPRSGSRFAAAILRLRGVR